ncbi:MAG: A/G-specific adenine glycosylase [bacterium]|nr:A/G-specific adenine glycosylase [bacterium]
MNKTQIAQFQHFINWFHDCYGRHHLPWRQDHNPYHIWVSEIMLQQTQVDRVIPKYLAFMQQFPSVESLAAASVAEIITAWQGLGYNRRGLNLQKGAAYLQATAATNFPQETTQLLAVPGIGPYTAAAIQAFAFNQPSIIIETNIRTVFIYHFFPKRENVTDAEIFELVRATLDGENPRKWYSALMDYGSYVKKSIPNPSRRSKTYTKQSSFVGSNRQVRGQLLKVLAPVTSLSYPELLEQVSFLESRVKPALQQLLKEGFIEYKADQYQLSGKKALQ